jgi:hypothetical protein
VEKTVAKSFGSKASLRGCRRTAAPPDERRRPRLYQPGRALGF